MEKIWKEEEPEAWEHLQAFKDGRTGFPWIVSDAMRAANLTCCSLGGSRRML